MSPSLSVKTRGIVLTHVKYGESSIIVRILTEELGLQSYIVNGVRSSKRKDLLPLLFPLSILEIEASNRPRTSLQRLKEIHVGVPFTSIPYNQNRRAVAFFMAEVLTHSLREDGPDQGLFQFIESSIVTLDSGIDGESNFHLLFMLELSRYLGFMPDFSCSALPYFDLVEGVFTDRMPVHGFVIDDQDKRLWMALGSATLQTLPSIAANRSERQRLVEILCDYFTCHLPSFRELRSQGVLQQLF